MEKQETHKINFNRSVWEQIFSDEITVCTLYLSHNFLNDIKILGKNGEEFQLTTITAFVFNDPSSSGF